eukprot:2374089-Prymnesium_polylepis.1
MPPRSPHSHGQSSPDPIRARGRQCAATSPASRQSEAEALPLRHEIRPRIACFPAAPAVPTECLPAARGIRESLQVLISSA